MKRAGLAENAATAPIAQTKLQKHASNLMLFDPKAHGQGKRKKAHPRGGGDGTAPLRGEAAEALLNTVYKDHQSEEFPRLPVAGASSQQPAASCQQPAARSSSRRKRRKRRRGPRRASLLP